MRSRWALIGAGVAVLALLAWQVAPRIAAGLTPPEHHLDGRGPLGSVGDPSAMESQAFGQGTSATRWTLGIHLCLVSGNSPAVLDGTVAPTKTLGTDFVFLGALMRQFTPSHADFPIGSTDGFPPTVSDPLAAVKGFVVTHPCQLTNPDPTIPYAELLLGFGRGAGITGGGWLGVDVGYNVDGRHHVVSLGYGILMCGPAVPAHYCYPPSPSPAT